MRSKYLKRLAATLMTTSLGIGWVSAGNLDQLNYLGVPGGLVSDLRTSPNNTIFPATPWDQNPYIELINPAIPVPPPTFIQTTGGNPQNSATWLRGFIEAPQTGQYTFWVSGSSDAEFWLSPSTSAGGAALEAYSGGNTGVNEWARRLTQKSRPIQLTKGQQYYFEVIQKSSGNSGLAQLGWFLPDYTLERPMPIRYAQRFAFSAVCIGDFCDGSFIAEKSVPTPLFDRAPGNNSSGQNIQAFLTENRPYDLTPWMTAQYPVAFQWQQIVGFVPGGAAGTPTDLAGDITAVKYIKNVTIADHHQKSYRIKATFAGSTATSPIVYLNVAGDFTPPTVLSASAAGSTNGFNVIFSENVDPISAANKLNYSVNNGVVVDRVEMRYGETPNNTVVVFTTTAIPGNSVVTVTGVKDIASAGGGNVIGANNTADIFITDGIISYYAYGAINGGSALGGTEINNLLTATNRYSAPSLSQVDRVPSVGVPDLRTVITQTGIPQNVADNYGALIVGFLVPPQTGNYNMVIAGDDQSIVYLGQTADPATKYAVAMDPQWGGWRDYTSDDRRSMSTTGNSGFISSNFPGKAVAANNSTVKANQSKFTLGNLPLIKGNKYYFEAVMKEGGGGDNVDVTWQLPGQWTPGNNNTGLSNGQAPIPGIYLSLFAAAGQAGPISIVQQPASTTTLENRPVSFSVIHGGSPSFAYQWYKNGIIIPDANAISYSEPLPDPVTEANAKYTVVVRNLFSGATSAEATLTVTPDAAPPTLVRAVGSSTFGGVTIWFSEVVDPATAVNAANYSIKETGTQNVLSIFGNGTLAGPQNGGFTKVVFQTAPQTQGQNYTVTVNAVKDIANSQNTIVANSTTTFSGWVVSKGFVLHEIWFNNTGNGVAGAKADPRYPNAPDSSRYGTFWESVESTDIAENYLGKHSGYFFAAAGAGRYDFAIASDDNGELWLANDSASGVAQTRIAEEPNWGDRRSWTGDSGGRRANGQNNTFGDNLAILTMADNERRYMEMFWKEGGGGDYGDVTMKTPAAAIPANGSVSTVRGAFIGALANPDETSFTFSQNLPATIERGEGTTLQLTANGSGQSLADKLNNPQTTAATFWQWQRKAPGSSTWTDISGANGTTYTTPILSPADNQASYRILANIPGKTTPSVETLLTVGVDTTRPTVTAASSLPGADGVQNRIGVFFSEPMQPSNLSSLANYTLTEGLTPLGITAATPSADNRSVILTVPNLTPGTAYNLAIRDIKDPATAQNVIDPNPTVKTVTGWTQAAGFVRRERYNNIGGGKVGDLTGNAKFPNSPDSVDFRDRIETPSNIADDFGQRLSGYLTPTADGKYYFAVSADDQTVLYLSTDATPANKTKIVTEPEWGGERDWNGNDRRVGTPNDNFFQNVTTLPVNRSQNTVGGKDLLAGQKYYFEVLTKEGGGGDNAAVTWWTATDNTDAATKVPGNGSAAIPASAVSGWVNPDNTINISAQPQPAARDAGQSVTFSVTANTTSPVLGGPLSYQWYRGVTLLAGATGSSYTDSNVQAGDVGNYTVVMKAPGAPDTTSAPAALSLNVSDVTLAITRTGNNVVVTYPTTAQVAGNALQKSTALPGGFGAETGGADVSGTYTKTVDVTAGGAAAQTYWRTLKP